MNQCGHQFYCFRINGSLLKVRSDVVVDVVVGSSTLILQELTNRNEMLVVFNERCCACAVLYAVWYNKCGLQFYCFRMNGSLLEVRSDVVVDVVVGSSTLILQELTNRNEMLVVFHERCCACAVLYAVWYNQCGLQFYCLRMNGSLLEVRSDVVVDVVGSSTLILQELTNRNEMLVAFMNIVAHAQSYMQCGIGFIFPNAQIILGSSFCDHHPDVVVVVGSGTLILQELTNRNQMLVVFIFLCTRRVFCSVAIGLMVYMHKT